MSTRRERAKAPAAQLNQQLAVAEKVAQCERLRKEKQKNLNRWAGELFTDMAKLVFAGVIIGGVFEKVDNPLLLYGAGFTFLVVFLYIGYVFIKKM
jgi:uncharacterized membrane protein YraQ (UPF0718 family)